jgi:hypothetical protein
MPASLRQISDLTGEAVERPLQPMPVEVTLLPDKTPIFMFDRFPTGRVRSTNLKGSDMTFTHKRCDKNGSHGATLSIACSTLDAPGLNPVCAKPTARVVTPRSLVSAPS